MALCVTAITAQAQNTLSGTITSVPTNTPPTQTRITFTNTANSNKYAQLTTNGNFSIIVPTGTRQENLKQRATIWMTILL